MTTHFSNVRNFRIRYLGYGRRRRITKKEPKGSFSLFCYGILEILEKYQRSDIVSCSQHELIQAIDNHLQVRFTYNGKLRTFEPYTILESEKDKILIWGILLNDKEPTRYFEIKLINNFSITQTRFAPDHSYSPTRLNNYKRIIYSIDPVKVIK